MLETIVDAIIGSNGFIDSVGGFLANVGAYNEGQAALLDVLNGEHYITQEWKDGEWVNVGQEWYQPIVPWNPIAQP